MKSTSCLCCNHIAVAQINSILTSPANSPGDLRVWLEEHYPTEPIPTRWQIINHRTKHLVTKGDNIDMSFLALDRNTGNIIDPSTGQTVEAVGIIATLKTIITIGVKNITQHPENITPQHTLDAIKILRQMGIKDDNPDEDVWAELVQPKHKQKVPTESTPEFIDIEVVDES